MGSHDNVTNLLQQEVKGINPAFIRSTVAVNIAQMRAGLEMHLNQPENQTPERQEFIRGLMAALPEAQTILIGAMELAVLGQHVNPETTMDAPVERYKLPKDPLALRRRIDKMQRSVLDQFEMLELPDVPDHLRGNVRAAYGEDLYKKLGVLLCSAAAEQLGFTEGAMVFRPR